MDLNSVYFAALGGAGVLAAMWWWHRRQKARRVTPDAKEKLNQREAKRAEKLQLLIKEAEALRDDGKLQRAADQYMAAVKLASKYYGKISMPLFRALQGYALVLFALDRPAALLTILTQCFSIARRLPQVPLDDRISLMLQLGDALIRTERDAEAEKLILKALELMENPPAVLLNQGGEKKVEEEEESGDVTPGGAGEGAATPGEKTKADPTVNEKKRAYAYWNLALIKGRELDRPASEKYSKKALEIFQSPLFGKTHPDTLSVELHLATVLYDQGQKEAGLVHIQRIWAVAQRAFDEKSMLMNAFLSFAHLLAQALVARDESRAAELILKSATEAPQLPPKLKPLQYYMLLNDLAALYWDTQGREEEAKALEEKVRNTLTSVSDHLPLSYSRTMRVVFARITATGVFIVNLALNAMLPASREPLYHIGPDHTVEIRFENPSNAKERVVLKRRVGQVTFIAAHSPLLEGFRHANNYVVDIVAKDKDGKVVGHVRQLVRYVAQFVLGAIVPGSADETLNNVAEEIRVSRKSIPSLLKNGDPKALAKEEEALTKLLLQLDSVSDEKHREHRRALVDTIQLLLGKIDATKAARTS